MSLSTFLEVWDNSLRSIEDGFQHHGDYFINLPVRQLHDRLGNPTACVVHPHIDMSELFDGAVTDTFNVRSPGHISLDNQRLGPSILCDPVQLILTSCCKNQMMAFRPQLLGQGRAYSATGTCDDSYLAHW